MYPSKCSRTWTGSTGITSGLVSLYKEDGTKVFLRITQNDFNNKFVEINLTPGTYFIEAQTQF
jgi:hypothetical protein